VAHKRLRLFILGPLQIQLGEEDLGKRVSAKGRALLAYLVLTGRAHTRSALAGLFWGESPEKDARRNLRVELSKLRRVVGEVVTATHETLAVDQDALWLDAAEFERLVITPDSPETVRQALALYRGDLLDDLLVRDAPLFEEWVLLERERLRQLAIGGLEQLVRWGIEQENFSNAIQDVRRLLLLDPWLESAHRNLMWMLARTGDRSGALAQYEACRQTLAQELGVEPAREITALYEQIKAGEIETAAKPDLQASSPGAAAIEPPHPHIPPNNLPAQTTSFVGRDQELSQIQELLSDPDCRLLTLIGPGGIGKTRLALQAATQLAKPGRQNFPEGVYFVPLAEVSAPDLAIPAIGEALGISFSGEITPGEQLANYFRDKALLLVLDNFEHLVAGAGFLTDFLKASPGLKILVTSRERIDLYEEWLLDVPGLPFPAEAEAPDFERFAAVQLFYQRARRIKLGFSVTAEKPAITRICQLVVGMPLGIELAAAWVRGMSCREIADRLQLNLDSLTATARNLPARQRSLRAAFMYSWDLLQVGEREAFARISVFHGGFTPEAALWVVGIESQTLASLADKSLLRKTPAGRFAIHPMLRVFGAEKFEADLSIQERHAQYYAGIIQEREPALILGGTEAIQVIQLEIDNLRAAWEWATTRCAYRILEDILVGLGSYYRIRGLFKEGLDAFSKAFQMLNENLEDEGTAPILLGKLLVWQGEYLDEMGRFQEAVDRFERALEIFEIHDASLERSLALAALGFSISGLGDNARALDYLQTGWEGLEIAGDARGMAVALHHLGIVRTQVGARAQGLKNIEESMDLFRQAGDRRGLSNAMSILGNIHIALGEYDRARALHEECQGIFDEIGDPMGQAHGLHSLSLVAFRQSNYEASEQFSRQALKIFSRFGVPYGITKALSNLGEIAWVKGEYERSKGHFLEALSVSRQVASLARHRGTGNVLRGLGRTEVALGDLSLAREHLKEVLEIYLEGQFIDSALDTYPVFAEYFAAAGQADFAVRILAHAVENPVAEDFARQEAGVILKSFLEKLDPDQGVEAIKAGQQQSFELLTATILENLA
jgi:predicted ATPase/DNA-binding SARP family transcriptional activator